MGLLCVVARVLFMFFVCSCVGVVCVASCVDVVLCVFVWNC